MNCVECEDLQLERCENTRLKHEIKRLEAKLQQYQEIYPEPLSFSVAQTNKIKGLKDTAIRDVGGV